MEILANLFPGIEKYIMFFARKIIRREAENAAELSALFRNFIGSPEDYIKLK